MTLASMEAIGFHRYKMKPHNNIRTRKIFTIPLLVNGITLLRSDKLDIYFRSMFHSVLRVMLVFLLTISLGFAQSPNLKCLSVDAVGDVQISWAPASDSCGVFNQYYIYASPTISGPFSLIDSVSNWASTTFNAIGAGADAGSIWYYIEVSSGCSNTISDTLETMYLSVNNSPSGTANLQWNSLHSPDVQTNSGMYLIFREDTATGTLQLVDSISQFVAFSDSYTSCSPDSTAYQIGMMDSSGCMSLSNMSSLIPDQILNETVMVDSASLDVSTGQVVLGWQATTAVDVVGYVITVYNIANQGYDDIDTVYGTTSYFDLFGNLSSTDSIFVYALDACGNAGPWGANGHSIVKLSGGVDTCRGVATLNWTPYYYFPSGIASYDVYISQDGGPFNYEATVNGNQFFYSGLIRGVSYCYFVRAQNGLGTKTSSSNVMCAYSYIDSIGPDPFDVTVERRDSIINRLLWNEDPAWSSNLIAQYDIYRSFDDGPFLNINSVPFGTSVFEDLLEPISDFSTGEGKFCYKVVPVKVSNNLYGCVSSSDSVCVNQFPKFILPNTFSPNGDGRNDVFRPVKTFIHADDFLLVIYSRWGQQLFETTNILEGWDGLIKGFPAQNDAYVYYVTFVIKDGIPVTRAGTVLLLR